MDIPHNILQQAEHQWRDQQRSNALEMYADLDPRRIGPIDVFRVGEFKSMNGKTNKWDADDLRSIVENYDPEAAPAPVVIGHPKNDAPAYGWVGNLEFDSADGVLRAWLDEVPHEFVEAIKEGRYKKVSISLISPDATNNPVPGQWYLKHVGFLGGAAPAVPGLKPVTFADEGTDWEFGFNATTGTTEFSMKKNKAGQMPVEHSELVAELEKYRRADVEQRIENVVGEGRLIPALQEQALEFAVALDDQDTLEFAGAEEKTSREWFLDFLDSLPEVVSYGATDMGDDALEGGAGNGISIPAGFAVDKAGEQIVRQARGLMSKNENLSFSEAVRIASER